MAKTKIKLLPTEWARTSNKDERFYLYFDRKLGIITKEKFNKIEV